MVKQNGQDSRHYSRWRRTFILHRIDNAAARRCCEFLLFHIRITLLQASQEHQQLQ